MRRAEVFHIIIDGRPCPEPKPRAKRGRPPFRAPLPTRTTSRDPAAEPQSTTAQTFGTIIRAAAARAAPAQAAKLRGIVLTNLLHSHLPLPSPLDRSLCGSSFSFSPLTRLLNRRRSLGRLQRPLRLRLLQFLSTFPLLFCGRTTTASATWTTFAAGTVTTRSWLTSSTCHYRRSSDFRQQVPGKARYSVQRYRCVAWSCRKMLKPRASSK